VNAGSHRPRRIVRLASRMQWATRSAVRAAKLAGDRAAEAATHQAVDLVKRKLDDGGPVWWTDGSFDLNNMRSRTPRTQNSRPASSVRSIVGDHRPDSVRTLDRFRAPAPAFVYLFRDGSGTQGERVILGVDWRDTPPRLPEPG
jgi:hypothetical protein